MGRRNGTAWAFIAFPLAILAVFVLIPTVVGLSLSLFQWSGGPLWTQADGWRLPVWVGLDNLTRMASDPRIGAGLRNTLIFVVASVPPTVLIAFALAVLLDAEWFRGRALIRTMVFMPTIVSIVAIGFVWRWVLDDQAGLLNWILSLVGVTDPPRWLVEGWWPLTWIIIVAVWRGIGFCVVLYLAALQAVPKSLYEAAALDGAHRFQVIRHITWPMVRPMTAFLLITGVIGSLQVFDLVFIMTGRTETLRTTVLNLEIYRNFTYGSYGYAAAIGVLIFALTAIVTAGQLAWFGRGGAR
ncbi:MAG: sugar ABC transporter permease [Phycisphaerales bacterium]|nr:sugar ABC transporter permease [Phycisphaerales bacterium]